MSHDLDPVTSPSDWDSYHAIRRGILWDARGRRGYDENHPDDRHPGHHPFLLKLDGVAVGTIRLDEIGKTTGVVRLVAITADRQRQGHGPRLMELVEAAARQLGLHRLVVNAASDATGFYSALGWSPGPWNDPDPAPLDVASEPMIKDLLRPLRTGGGRA